MGFSRSAPLTGGGTIYGNLTIDGDCSVTGSTAITTNEVIQGTSIIDVTNTEALLVRKNSDGGDVFTVDTTNSQVELGPAVKLVVKRNGHSGTLSMESGNGYLELQALGDRSIDLKSQRQIRMYTSDDGASYTQALNLSATGGNATFLGTVTVGADGSGKDVTFYSDTAGDSFVWDSSAEKLTITGTNGQTALDIADGNLVVADNVDIEGDIDVNGTANFDTVDIDGDVDISGSITNAAWTGDVIASAYLDADTAHLSGTQTFTGNKTFTGTVTTGVDDTGVDVKFFGATSGKYMLWDESGDDLIVNGAIGINGTPSYDLHIAGTRVQVDGDTPVIVLKDTSAYSQNTGAQIVFQGLDSASATRDFGYIQGSSRGSNDGALDFYTRGSGTNALRMRIDEGGDVSIGGNLDIDGTTNLDAVDIDGNVQIDGTFTQDAGVVVFNEAGGDYDFRIESDTNANMFYLDAGNERVGIGGAPGAATFEVAGTTGKISQFGTLTNNWAANHAFGVANGTGIMISDLGADNNTAANRVIGLQRDDTNGHSIYIYDPSGNADIALRGNSSSYIKGGSLGVGTDSPSYKLEVKAAVTGDWISRIYNEADASNPSGLLVRLDDPDTTGIILGVHNGSGYRAKFGASITESANIIDITDTTDATDATGDTGALRVEGGASIAKKLYVGTDLDVDGTTNLDAVDIDGEVNVGGNYTVHDAGRQKHVANTMPAPSMHFNADTYGYVAHDDKHNNVDKFHFSIEVRFKLETGTQLLLSNIQGWLNNGWVLRAYDGGSGSNVWRVRLSDGSSTLDYNPNATWEFGKWVHAVFTFDRSGNLTIYQDGVSVGTSDITSYSAAGVTNTSGKLAFGTYTGNDSGTYKDVEISHFRFHNRILSADEVKHYYSGGSVPYKYQGADNTHRITSGTVSAYDAASGNVSAQSTTAVTFDTSGWGTVAHSFSSTLEQGKIYRVTFAGASTTGSGCITRFGTATTNSTTATALAPSGSWGAIPGYTAIPYAFTTSATYGGYYTAVGTENCIAWKNYDNADETVITSLDVREVGCIIDFDPTGISADKWFDKSGNDLHLALTNGAIHNAPTADDGLIYEEGTWSPVICQADDLSDALAMHAETTGSYVRIGSVVHVSGQVIGNSSTGDMSASDSLAIKGLPYATPNSQYNRGAATLVSLTGNLASGKRVSGYIIQNASQINLYTNDGTAEGALRFDEFTNAGHAVFQGTYII